MINSYDWLPMGTIIRGNEGEHTAMIAGVMVTNQADGKFYDYLAYPYPEGRTDGEGYFLNKDDIAEILQIGFMNSTGMLYQDYLNDRTPEFESIKSVTNEGNDD